MSHDNKIQVILCMGSSCFSRGSKDTLRLLEDYIQSHKLESVVQLKGTLCKNSCKNGPNLSINGISYDNVKPSTAIDILKHNMQNF